MTRAALLLGLLTGAAFLRAADPDPKSLAIPPADAARASELVGKLASRDFSERVEATAELRQLGRLALPALRSALASSTHPEVRRRAEGLLPVATTADIQARLACFLADTNNAFQHDLPGGTAFFAATGRSETAKNLYARILRSPNQDMVLAVEGPVADLRRKLDSRRVDLDMARREPRTDSFTQIDDTDVAAILFVESFLPDTGPTVGELGWGIVRNGRGRPLVGNTLFQSLLESALSSDTRRDGLAGLARRWMETRTHPQSVYSAVMAMNRANLADALPAARHAANGTVIGGPITYRAQAVAYLARFGTPDDLPTVEKLFTEKETLTVAVPGGVGGPGGRRTTIQFRDLALAMALLMTKQEPADYGLDYRNYYYGSSSDAQKYNPTAYSFDVASEERADELREAAFKKYAEWKGAQPKGKK